MTFWYMFKIHNDDIKLTNLLPDVFISQHSWCNQKSVLKIIDKWHAVNVPITIRPIAHLPRINRNKTAKSCLEIFTVMHFKYMSERKRQRQTERMKDNTESIFCFPKPAFSRQRRKHNTFFSLSSIRYNFQPGVLVQPSKKMESK